MPKSTFLFKYFSHPTFIQYNLPNAAYRLFLPCSLLIPALYLPTHWLLTPHCCPTAATLIAADS